MEGEDRVAGGHDRPVDRMARVVAGLEWLEYCGSPSVICSGAVTPVRRAT
jgi:hypothetical protein